MQRLIILILLLSTGSLALALEPYRIVYDVKVSGLRGQIETTLTRLPIAENTPEQYELKSVTRTKGLAKILMHDAIVEWSHFNRGENGYQPVEFNYINGKADHKRSNQIIFTADKAVSTYKFETVELDLLPGDTDRVLEQLLVREALLNGATPDTYRVVDRNEIGTINYVAHGTQTLDTPMGRLETLKFSRERADSSRSTHFWFAPKLDYQPVRIEQFKDGESTAIAKLKSYQRLSDN